MVNAKELFVLKAAALLHDPPHKPWVIAEHIGRCSAVFRGHEDEARTLLRIILSGTELGLADARFNDKRVVYADALASSIDRYLVSVITGGEARLATNKVVLKNIFSPFLSIDLLEECSEKAFMELKDKVKDYALKLSKILKSVHESLENVEDEVRALIEYHLLYALFELVWLAMKLPIGPADTRMPSHSIFDHNYAVAAMLNWVLRGDEVNGLLVGLDVAGVQDFISCSRKLRDLWVSSYLVSALLWYTVKDLVLNLGPDVLVIPTARCNPFYLHMLPRLLEDHGVERKAVDEVKSVLNEVKIVWGALSDIYQKLGIPPYAVIPGRATLVLPPHDILCELINDVKEYENVEEYLKSKFREGWRKLWNAVMEYLEAVSKGDDVYSKFLGRIRELLSSAEEYGFADTPPLALRVKVEKVHGKLGKDMWKLYDEKYRDLTLSMYLEKMKKKEPCACLKLYDLTKKASGEPIGWPQESRRGFDYCTMCGKLPAILVLPGDEDYHSVILKELGFTGESVDENLKQQVEELKIVFAPGEKLCPWCLVKRILSLKPILINVLLLPRGDEKKVTREAVEKKAEIWFPSLSDIASVDARKSLLTSDGVKRLCEELEKRTLEKRALNDYLNFLVRYSKVERQTPWKLLYESEKQVKEVIGSVDSAELEKLAKYFGAEVTTKEVREILTGILRGIMVADPEDMWLSADSSKKALWRRIVRDVRAYYALIRADADNLGLLLEGRISSKEDYGKIETRNYLINLAEGPLKEVVDELIGLGDLKALADKHGLDVNALREASRELRIIVGEGRVPVTPSWHVTISAALMRIAALDAAIVIEDEGFPVYAAGDDLLAVIPVKSALEAIMSSRLAYSGASMSIESLGVQVEKGFLKLGEKCYLPLMPRYGKSYVLYIAHYRYPLSMVISSSGRLLERAKHHVRVLTYFITGGSRESEKDLLVVAYNPRGGEIYSFIPFLNKDTISEEKDLSKVGRAVEACSLLVKLISKGVIPRSRIYSFIEQREAFKAALEALCNKPKELLEVMKKLSESVVLERMERRQPLEPEVEKSLREALTAVIEGLDGIVSVKEEEFGTHIEDPLLNHVVLSVKIILSGMRGE